MGGNGIEGQRPIGHPPRFLLPKDSLDPGKGKVFFVIPLRVGVRGRESIERDQNSLVP